MANAGAMLIVEDDALFRSLLRKILERDGFNVLDAGNGREGLRAYRRHRPGLIITDVLMPEVDGIEMLLALRREDAEVRVVAMSGADPARVDHLRIMRALGADAVLRKPFSQMELRAAVASCIGPPRGDAPPRASGGRTLISAAHESESR